MFELSPVDLHPASYRHLSQGHPWVIKDQYTEKFRAKARLLRATDKKTGKEFILLGDTAHPKVKARLWQQFPKGIQSDFDFLQSLKERLEEAIKKRMPEQDKREDFFLVFGEADFLPGLFLLQLGQGVVIQSYARYWKKFQKDLIPLLKEIFPKLNLEIKWMAWQERDDSKKTSLIPLWGKLPEEEVVSEFGVKYLVKFNEGYDLGLYPDMAAIRESLPFDWKDKKVLNLYAYTGAWSLYPLSQGAKAAVSVDLSGKYLNWLEQNLALNSFESRHRSIESDTQKALEQLIKEGEEFDFILCDPPSFSSDGKKTQTSLKAYKNLLPLLEKLLSPKGQLLSFINTHSVTRKKYEETMKEYSGKTKLRKIKSIGLQKDCPLIKNFPEGDYLKGILFQK